MFARFPPPVRTISGSLRASVHATLSFIACIPYYNAPAC